MGKNKNSAKSVDTDSYVPLVAIEFYGNGEVDVGLVGFDNYTRGGVLRKFVRGLRCRKSAAKVVREGRAAIRCGLVTGRRA